MSHPSLLLSVAVLASLSMSIQAQVLAPADTLMEADLRLSQRLALQGISSWQHFSYGHPGYNCQFEPSCSHFMALAIAEKGTISGVIAGTDRIVRCNPSARRNHSRISGAMLTEDYRLLEPVDFRNTEQPSRQPLLAAGLSLVPGLGRIYAGHRLDGLLSMLMVGSFGFITFQHADEGNVVMGSFTGGVTLLLWTADIYGAYRTAKLSGKRQ